MVTYSASSLPFWPMQIDSSCCGELLLRGYVDQALMTKPRNAPHGARPGTSLVIEFEKAWNFRSSLGPRLYSCSLSSAAGSLLRVEPWTTQWQSLVPEIELRVCPRGHDAFPREQIRRPEWKPIYLRVCLVSPFQAFVSPAWILLCLLNF